MSPKTGRDEVNELEKLIHREIPISSAMGARVQDVSLRSVTLSAPLAPNKNHQGTAFGGSVHSLAILSCWALVNVVLSEFKQAGLQLSLLVVQDSWIDYKFPIDSDFTARSSWLTAEAAQKFLVTLSKKGRARTSLKAEVSNAQKVCAILDARFVAQLSA